MKKHISLFFVTALVCMQLNAQVNENIIQQSALSVTSSYNLSAEDVNGFVITDNYTRSNGNSHVYIVQTANGFEIFNAILQLHFSADGKLAYSNSRFVMNKNTKTNTATALVNAETALKNTAKEIGISPEKITVRTENTDQKNKTLLLNESLFRRPVRVTLGYELLDDKLLLAYKLIVEPKGTNDMFNIRVDAQTGKVIQINNRTLYCQADHTSHTENCAEPEILSPLKMHATAVYNAYPLGIESPIYGSRQLLTGIESASASPFGWHDVNGVTGGEFTITRGNNVFAYEDQADEDTPGYSPNAGSSLNFNYPLNLNQAPTLNMDAALTNLFVWNNFMHDVTYFYGFDEVSGNFQANNYNHAGESDDYVLAEGFDGSGTNNANFGTPEDGFNPTMQMYLWYHEVGNLFKVNTPAPIAGSYATGSATFGPPVPQTPLIANLVLMLGNNGVASQGCGTITNSASLNGKIALVDRGNCTFVQKALNAQNAGAIAMVLINNQGGAPPSMGGTDNGQVTIPCVSISQSNGNLIKAQLQNGSVNASVGGTVQEFIYDCNFDNGIISHEYGHGISNRLTGGPQNVDCLENDEQAGEGWSDFFSLIMTDKSTSTISDIRGIGNYADNQAVNGYGIRPYPYTLDMTINPLTYEDIDQLAIPHGVGSVWCTMVWDLYLNLVSVYGHSHNVYSEDGGNNIAVSLVMEGLRLQPCSPGFVDARNAILQADQQLYSGANQCIIWKTFARRGLGFSASQGSSDIVGDENEAFDLPPSCSASDVDFVADVFSVCAGNTVSFQNLVFPVGSSFSWTFTGGTPATSIDPAPNVTYNTVGNYPVTLTATNVNGNQTVTKQSYIHITQSLEYVIATTSANSGNNGTATVTQQSGVAPYTYSWTGFPNATGATISGLTSGTYNVTVTDASGCSSTKQFIIGINNSSIQDNVLYSIQVFPNPASDMLYITSNDEQNMESITITDISGKQISTQIINASNASLDISNYAAGMYLLQVNVGEQIFVRRFVKN